MGKPRKHTRASLLEDIRNANACEICSQPETAKLLGKTKALAQDHNHQTGQLRGLLCQRCNVGLGLLRENISILKRMIVYLNKWDNSFCPPTVGINDRNQ